jgi:hypothetical protein
VAGVIIEGIQGVGGIIIPDDDFMRDLRQVTKDAGVVLILDEVQSGYGRSGKFFAHQWAGIKPDVITMAKGMAGGFPIGGVLISPEFEPVKGMLGTTFGGNHLAMAAAIAVADIIKEENLVQNALEVGEYLKSCLQLLASGLASPDRSHPRLVRGRGPLAERVGGAERSEESGLSEPDASSLSFATGDSEQSEAVGPPELASAIKEVPGPISESLCSEPWRRAAAKPSPNSMPRTPGIENTAWEIKDSTESKNGSPRPAGTPST